MISLMRHPDVTLEQVHRNAGEIERFANFLRQGGKAGEWRRQPDCTGEKVTVLPRGTRMDDFDWRNFDQVICAYNRTRVEFNTVARNELGRSEGEPAVGDRVMCLKNNRALGLFNGMQGEATRIDVEKRRMVFRSDGRDYLVSYDPDAFNRIKRPEHDGRRKDNRLPFDYAYCVTAHKAQGDEWDSVLVVEQRCDLWDHKRWAYTAASRAKKHLTWVEE